MITWVAASALAGTVVFDVGGVQVKGDGLTVVPVGAPAVTEVDAYGQVFDGILEVILNENDRLGGLGTVVIMPPSDARLGGGRTVGAGQVTEIVLAPAGEADGGIGITTIHPPSAAKEGWGTGVLIPPSAKAIEEDGGLFLAGDPPAWAVDLPDGAASVGVNVAGTDRVGQFVFGTTSYLETRLSNFVFGTTSYLEARLADFVFGTTSYFRHGGGNFVYGQVIYFRLADGSVVPVTGGAGSEGGVGAVRTDFDAKSCLAGVWSGGALAYSAEVPCDAVAAYADSAGGVPVAVGAAASVTPSGAPQLAWSWADGVQDPSNGASWPR